MVSPLDFDSVVDGHVEGVVQMKVDLGDTEETDLKLDEVKIAVGNEGKSKCMVLWGSECDAQYRLFPSFAKLYDWLANFKDLQPERRSSCLPLYALILYKLTVKINFSLRIGSLPFQHMSKFYATLWFSQLI